MRRSLDQTPVRRSDVSPHHAMHGFLIGAVAGTAIWGFAGLIVSLVI
jgi:hypothetical protein